jgi:dienelactone hydrolase
MLLKLATVVVVLLVATISQAAIVTEEIKYKHGEVECKGFLAYDDAVQGPRPGVLVVHEWWGLNDYARDRAKQLAQLGYVAFACDMYGEGKVVDHPKEATEMVTKVRANVEDWRKRAVTALDVLKKRPECDKTKLAAMGYCFGGSTALQLAYSGADLKAVATFHAALPTPTSDEAKAIKAQLLVCHGADDGFIPAESIKKFRDTLDEAKTKYEFVAYPGAKHSFTVADADRHGNDGMKYNKSADEESWKALKKLLGEALK